MLAIREALVNAVCHKNYADRAGYISIAISDENLEIWNNGTLPSVLKIENLKQKHDSILRNELIAKIFYLRGYIEAWGTGTTKMIDLCKNELIPVPRFSERTGGFSVMFKFAEPLGSSIIQKTSKLTSRQNEILRLLEKSPLTSVQIAAKLPSSPKIRIVQIDLKKLEIAGMIKREGGSRATNWQKIK